MPLTSSDAPNAGVVMLEGLYFNMLDGRTRVRCRVTEEALQDRAGRANMAQDGLMSIFETFQDEIESIASMKYDRGGDPVVVLSSDLNP